MFSLVLPDGTSPWNMRKYLFMISLRTYLLPQHRVHFHYVVGETIVVQEGPYLATEGARGVLEQDELKPGVVRGADDLPGHNTILIRSNNYPVPMQPSPAYFRSHQECLFYNQTSKKDTKFMEYIIFSFRQLESKLMATLSSTGSQNLCSVAHSGRVSLVGHQQKTHSKAVLLSSDDIANEERWKSHTSGALLPAYIPREVEHDWYDWWEGQGYFSPQFKSEKRFSLVLPPPNVTGTLHLGHALTCTIQDVLARWYVYYQQYKIWPLGDSHLLDVEVKTTV
uniref:valine--tRNA ligase n=1 Tax=Timema cristinae TaxID=61476 RepID=A0A7R9CWA3_TIMCR|nr:unnamed protein product [Timema cristinae]